MKSLTRIGLPIFVVVAAVFGITFVRVYSPDDPSNDGPRTKSAKSAGKDLPLTIPIVKASPVSSKPEPGRESLIYWDPEFEVGMPGHFEFWAHNSHAEPVNVRLFDVNCQCAGVEVAPVPQEAYKEYAVASAVAGGPFCVAPPLLAAIAHGNLDRRLAWAPILDGAGEKRDQTIPGADPSAGTQVAIVRLGWKPKTETGQKNIQARILAEIGEAQPQLYSLDAHILVVPSFDLLRRDGPTAWAPVPDLSLGELRENGEARRVVYLLSTTRQQLVFRVSTDRPDPCVTWTEPVLASAEEIQSMYDFFSRPGQPSRRLKSVYKFEVTVRERTESESRGQKQFHQLDLGLLDLRLTISAIDGGSLPVPVKARVLGDISFLAGAPDGRLDLGTSFPVGQDWTKDVTMVAERPGLDLTLVAAETTPNYLKVKLDPLEKIDGRNQWRLRVTVPKGKLIGALPPDSAVVLTTTGPNPRRVRIPVRGMTYDSGEPRI